MIPNNSYDPDKIVRSVLGEKSISDINSKSSNLKIDPNDIFKNLQDDGFEQGITLDLEPLKEAKVEIIDTYGLEPTFIPVAEGSIPIVSTNKIFELKETSSNRSEILEKIGNKNPINIISFFNNIKNTPVEDYKNYFAHINKESVDSNIHCELVDFDRLLNRIDKEPIDLDDIVGITDKSNNHTVFQPEFLNLLKENDLEVEYTSHPENHEENKNFKIDFSDPNHIIDVATHDSWISFDKAIKVIKNEILENNNVSNNKKQINDVNSDANEKNYINNNEIRISERTNLKSKEEKKDKHAGKNERVLSSHHADQLAEQFSENKKISIDHQKEERRLEENHKDSIKKLKMNKYEENLSEIIKNDKESNLHKKIKDN